MCLEKRFTTINKIGLFEKSQFQRKAFEIAHLVQVLPLFIYSIRQISLKCYIIFFFIIRFILLGGEVSLPQYSPV